MSIIDSNVFDSELTFGEAIAALETWNLDCALAALAMINAATATLMDRPVLAGSRDAQRRQGLLHFLFAPEHYVRAEAVARSQVGKMFVPVSPQGCAAMTEACLRHCTPSGGIRFNTPSTVPVFAQVLTTFQRFLLPSELFRPNLDFGNLTDRQFALLACNYLSSNSVHMLGARPARHYAMFELDEPNSEMRRRTGRSAREWFNDILEIDPLFFRVLTLAVLGIEREFSIDAPESAKLVLNLQSKLSQLKPPLAAIFRNILLRSEIDLADVRASPHATDWSDALYYYNYVRRKQLWRLADGRHLIVHSRFLVEKFFEGFLHILSEAAEFRQPTGWSANARDRTGKVRNEMGYVFEDYGRTLLQLMFANPACASEFGYELNGREKDAIIAVPGAVLLFEFCHRPISTIERNTGEMARFLYHLEDNFEKLLEVRDHLRAGGAVMGRTFTSERIIPIVVTSETFPISHLNAAAFGQGLRERMGANAIDGAGRVAPTQLLGIEQLESLGRTRPAEGGPEGIAEFLWARAQDLLERFTASPTCGQPGGRVNLWQRLDDAADLTFTQYSPLVFRPECLPADWHGGSRALASNH